jgi:hypothetical protein
MRNKTYMSQHYKYYVYVCAGHIKYFETLSEAQEYASMHDAEVQEMDA